MHDLIYCFRMLRKRPSFTVVAVLTLALAIGASTALFSIVNVVVLNPFPYKDPSRLFFVRQSLPKIGLQEQLRVSGPEFVDLEKSGIFERVSAFETVSRNLTGSDEPERVAAAKVSTEFFNILGIEPMLGRTIAPNEQGPNGQRVLVISYGLWQRRFGGDKAVLGQKVSLDDEPFTIIGVMPPQFRFEESQAWFPFPYDFNKNPREGRTILILARISSATSEQQVNAALANLARQNEQDFGGAINAYAEVTKLLPDDAQAYVDLGRAYEKNDQVPQAIKSYTKATQLAPQHPTAFLLPGIMYGKQIDLTNAFQNFDRADTLYQAAGNIEGQAEVAYQRGVLLDQLDKNVEAQSQFEHALQLGRDTHSEYQEVKSLLKLGYVICAQGNSEQGRALMQQGIDLAQTKAIDTYIKRGLVDIGNTYLLTHEYGEARKYFQQSLERSQREKDPRNSARALLSLASASERQDNLDQALSYIEQALPFYQRGGYRRETIQAFAILARTKKKKGEYEAAREGFEQELKVAQFLGDQSSIARVNGDIGLLMMSQGRYPEALTHFEEGYRISKESKFQENIGLSLTNRANALWNLGRYNEAKPLLDEVGASATKPEGRGYAAWYYLSASQMALSERKFAEAQKLAESAIKADSQPALTENAVLGLAQVLSGASQAGLASCQKALSMIKPATDPALAAEARLAVAQALLQKGDNAEALKAALDSQQIFSRFGKQDSEWLALLIAARARKNDGDAAQARDFASRAETLLAGLQQKWGDTSYQSYLTRPDIQFYRSQLNELLAQKP